MTLTSWDLALAAIAAPEPESRLTSRSTLAPFVIACSACCCWVALSPSAFWIVASTPAALKASERNGRSTVSQRTDDLESGSSTATLPGLSPPPPPPPPEPPLDSSSPHPATASAHPAATVAINHAPRCMGFLLLLIGLSSPPAGSPRSHHGAQRMVALGLGQHERDGAEHLGAVAERAGDDGGRLDGRGERGPLERLAHAAEQQLARVREVAADDQQLRVEHVHERRGGLADRAPGVGDHAPADEVALARQAHDGAAVEALAVAAGEQLGERVGAGHGLQAAAVAAAAQRAVGVDEHVAELAGQALRAAVQAPVEHQPGA